MKKLVSMILCFAMVLSIAACGGTAGSGTPSPSTGSSPSSDGTETIKIGVLTPLTGASAQLGGQTVEVYQMLVDIINEEHPELAVAMAASAGITSMNGAKIELVVADHKSDA